MGATKAAWLALFPDFVLDLIREFLESGDKLHRVAVTTYARRHQLLPVKYIRKFAYNAMLSAGIPESVADFLHGRARRTVGAKHYMDMKMQAETHYPKYASYIERLWETVNAGS